MMFRAGAPQANEEDGETWGVHRASQSASSMSQGKVNALIACVLVWSFVLNATVGEPRGARRGGAGRAALELENYLVLVILSSVVTVWLVLLFKIRECTVWPEEVRFKRNGMILVELGCGHRALNTVAPGVLLMRKRANLCNSNLGVWANAITDKTRDDVFVLVPALGSRFWTGFAFQPEDPEAFLHDCRHAGVAVLEDGSSELGVRSQLEEGLLADADARHLQQQQQQRMVRDGDDEATHEGPGGPIEPFGYHGPRDSSASSATNKDLEQVLTNNTIIEV
jgi:hypothetical protein